jgi:hypothetical protein
MVDRTLTIERCWVARSKMSKVGLYSGFESYRVLSSDNIKNALQHGMLALDTNVLLNLYRYVTIQVVGRGVGVQGFPVTAAAIASKVLMPCLRAVET